MEKTNDILSPEIRIKVIGAGGAGNSVLERLVEDGITNENVELIAVNTDARALKYMQNIGVKTLQIGENLTNGYGTGGNLDKGEKAAEDDAENLKEIIRDAEIIFLTAGFGGGVGTGTIPVLAKLAREMGILCVGIVTMPFSFEGGKRRKIAEAGLEKVKDVMDALIVIENNSLLKIVDKKLSIEDAFREADSVLRNGIRLIYELVMQIGFINVDFADVKSLLKSSDKSEAILGIGESESRSVVEAVQKTINSPLLSHTIKGAGAIIFNIYASEMLELSAIEEAMEYIKKETQREDIDVFLGVTLDENIGEKIRTMLIATDFQEES